MWFLWDVLCLSTTWDKSYVWFEDPFPFTLFEFSTGLFYFRIPFHHPVHWNKLNIEYMQNTDFRFKLCNSNICWPPSEIIYRFDRISGEKKIQIQTEREEGMCCQFLVFVTVPEPINTIIPYDPWRKVKHFKKYYERRQNTLLAINIGL